MRAADPVTPLTRAIGYEAGVRTRLWDESSGFFYDAWAVQDPKMRTAAFEGMWPLVTGIATPRQAQRVIDEVRRLGLEVDFLVNNAGFGTNGGFAELDAAIAEENRRARRSGRDPYNEFGAEPGPLLPSGSRTTEAPEREGGLVSPEPAARVRGAGA